MQYWKMGSCHTHLQNNKGIPIESFPMIFLSVYHKLSFFVMFATRINFMSASNLETLFFNICVNTCTLLNWQN